jgi:hypothetical protein
VAGQFSGKSGNRWNQRRSYSLFQKAERSERMADDKTANVAFERAWSVYLLINNDVNENDERRSTLERYIRKHCEAGENDPETLTVGGLAYLRKLDQLESFSFQ